MKNTPDTKSQDSQTTPMEAAQTVHTAIRAQLERSSTVRTQTEARARQLETDAAGMIKHLNEQWPALSRAVKGATDPQAKADASRQYLKARQNLARCHQNFRLARRQRIIASNL